MSHHGLFLYVDDVRISQGTHLWASTACYRDSFTSLYVDNVRTSQETRVFTAFYSDSFTYFSGLFHRLIFPYLMSTTTNLFIAPPNVKV
jgi:hypothetical protein